MLIAKDDNFAGSHPEPNAKHRYKTPALHVFGKVSTLTQSASGCNNNDSSMCSAPAGNMGPKP